MRVLIAEDDEELAGMLAVGLRRENMAVDVALDGTSAAEKVTLTPYDVFVLDRDLPGVHGDEVCREVVASGASTRILMLTAAGHAGRASGRADAGRRRLPGQALRVRRTGGPDPRPGPSQPAAPPPRPAFGDLLMDPARQVAERAGRQLQLTRKEFGMLEVLLAADGAVVTTEELLDRIWDENADPFTNTVRTTMMRLRRKLGQPPLIVTLPGRGYRVGTS